MRNILVSSIACVLLATTSARADEVESPSQVPPAPAKVRLHFRARSNEGSARVFLRTPGTDHHLLCTTPCTTELTPGDVVRIGQGATADDAGEDFVVPAVDDEHRDIDVKPGPVDSGALVGGTTLVVIGSGAIVGGLVFLASQSKANGGNPAAGTAGLLLAGAGVGVLIGGIFWLRGRTKARRVVTSTTPRDDHARAEEASAKPRDPFMPIAAASTPLTWAVHF